MCKSKDILISTIVKPSARAKAALYEYLRLESVSYTVMSPEQVPPIWPQTSLPDAFEVLKA
jgi:hypothetical protein